MKNFRETFECLGFEVESISINKEMAIVEVNTIGIAMKDIDSLKFICDEEEQEWELFEIQLNFMNGDDVTLLMMYH